MMKYGYQHPPKLISDDWEEHLRNLLDAYNNPHECDVPRVIKEAGKFVSTVTTIQNRLMELFPKWDRRVPDSRPATLLKGCNWWNGIYEFEIKKEWDDKAEVVVRSRTGGDTEGEMDLMISLKESQTVPCAAGPGFVHFSKEAAAGCAICNPESELESWKRRLVNSSFVFKRRGSRFSFFFITEANAEGVTLGGELVHWERLVQDWQVSTNGTVLSWEDIKTV